MRHLIILIALFVAAGHLSVLGQTADTITAISLDTIPEFTITSLPGSGSHYWDKPGDSVIYVPEGQYFLPYSYDMPPPAPPVLDGVSIEAYADFGFSSVEIDTGSNFANGAKSTIGFLFTSDDELPFFVDVSGGYASYYPPEGGNAQRNAEFSLALGLARPDLLYGGLKLTYAPDLDRTRNNNYFAVGLHFKITPARIGKWRPFVGADVGFTTNSVSEKLSRGSSMVSGRVGALYSIRSLAATIVLDRVLSDPDAGQVYGAIELLDGTSVAGIEINLPGCRPQYYASTGEIYTYYPTCSECVCIQFRDKNGTSYELFKRVPDSAMAGFHPFDGETR